MKVYNFIYERIIDPLILKLQNRTEHLNTIEPIKTHAGEKWKHTATIGEKCIFYPDADIINCGEDNIKIGSNCHLRCQLLAFDNGSISIGNYTFIGSDSKLWSHCKIEIGDHVMIAHQVEIHDSNYHSLKASTRKSEIHDRFDNKNRMPNTLAEKKAVIIENDVWIGLRSIILKGVTIGQGSVIGAGSVVTKNVPPYSFAAGNPARIISEVPK